MSRNTRSRKSNATRAGTSGRTPSSKDTNNSGRSEVVELCKTFNEKLANQEKDKFERAIDIPYFVQNGIDRHPTNSGTVCPDASEWLGSIENRCPEGSWTDEGMIKIAVKYAVGNAALCANMCKESCTKWKDFKKMFLTFYPPSCMIHDIFSRLEKTTKLKSESLEAFNVRLQHYVKQVIRVSPQKEGAARFAAVRKFISIFPEGFAKKIPEKEQDDYQLLLEHGRNYINEHPHVKLIEEDDKPQTNIQVNAASTDRDIDFRGQTSTGPSSPWQTNRNKFSGATRKRDMTCSYCKKVGHSIEMCYFWKGQPSAPMHKRQRLNLHSGGSSTSNNNPRSNVKCYRCKGWGHTQRVCGTMPVWGKFDRRNQGPSWKHGTNDHFHSKNGKGSHPKNQN